MTVLWTIPALALLIVGAASTPYFMEQARIYEQGEVQVLEIQANPADEREQESGSELGW